MRWALVWLLAPAPFVVGQDVMTTLRNRPELSTFYTYVNASKILPTLLSSINSFTLLAPSNDAFTAWSNSQASLPPGDDKMDALLTYHVLRGSFPTVAFTNVPNFKPSYLNSTTFTNVTGGQAVGIASNRAGPFVISGNKTQITLLSKDIIVVGGLIHILNSVMDLPLSLINSIAQSNLNFFTAIITQGGYLSPDEMPFLASIMLGTDVTIFAPNTRGALTTFTSKSSNFTKTQSEDIFNYHIVPNFKGYFPNLKDGMTLTTAEGKELSIRVIGNTTFINSARITASNFLTANGVLHTIDTLLDPQNITNVTTQQVATALGSTISNSNSNNTTSSQSSTLGIGAIAGISSGSTLLLSFILLLVYLHLRRRWARKNLSQVRLKSPYTQQIKRPILHTNAQELDTTTTGEQTAASSPASTHATTHDTYYHGTYWVPFDDQGRVGDRGRSETKLAVSPIVVGAGAPTLRPEEIGIAIELDASQVPASASYISRTI